MDEIIVSARAAKQRAPSFVTCCAVRLAGDGRGEGDGYLVQETPEPLTPTLSPLRFAARGEGVIFGGKEGKHTPTLSPLRFAARGEGEIFCSKEGKPFGPGGVASREKVWPSGVESPG